MVSSAIAAASQTMPTGTGTPTALRSAPVAAEVAVVVAQTRTTAAGAEVTRLRGLGDQCEHGASY